MTIIHNRNCKRRDGYNHPQVGTTRLRLFMNKGVVHLREKTKKSSIKGTVWKQETCELRSVGGGHKYQLPLKRKTDHPKVLVFFCLSFKHDYSLAYEMDWYTTMYYFIHNAQNSDMGLWQNERRHRHHSMTVNWEMGALSLPLWVWWLESMKEKVLSAVPEFLVICIILKYVHYTWSAQWRIWKERHVCMLCSQ